MLRTASIVPEDDDLTERRTSAREDIARKLAVEKEKWERSRERERRLAERRSRSRSPLGGWVCRTARGAGGAGRGGGRAGGGGLQRADMSSHYSSSQDSARAVTSESDVEVRRAAKQEKEKVRKEERKKEEEEGVMVMVPVDVLSEAMPVFLKEGFSTRQSIFAVSTVLVASGADLEKFNISLGHCQRSKTRQRESIGSTALANFATEAKDGNFPLVVHYDVKQLTQDFDGRKETLAREVLVVTSPHLKREVLLAAVPLEQETGLGVKTEMFNELDDLGIKDQVVMEVADSTNVNFGRNEGAVIHLQVLLQKPLLAVECVHHTEELPAKRVMEVVSERPSTSPEDKMFANIKSAWNKIMDADNDDAVYGVFDWAAHTGTGQEVAAREVLAWAKEAKKLKKYSRGDYNDCLNLILFFL